MVMAQGRNQNLQQGATIAKERGLNKFAQLAY